MLATHVVGRCIVKIADLPTQQLQQYVHDLLDVSVVHDAGPP